MDKNSYLRLTHSWDMILCIGDFINCIALHKADLKSPRNIGFMEFNKDFLHKKDFNPARVLNDYIYLEANSFFQYAKKLKNECKDMPDLPDYLKELKTFRDIVVGHKDFKERIKSPENWIKIQQEISKMIPIEKLIKDVDEYYKEFKKK